MSLDEATLDKLNELQKQGEAGRASYYQTLQAAKDPYGKLALGVVRQDQMAGMVAYSYAVEVAKRYCRPFSSDGWLALSTALMQADFLARRDPGNFDKDQPSLQWRIIRNYHALAFQRIANLPAIAWTAWIPLVIQGEARAGALWHRMLTENFLSVAVETAALVAGRLAQTAGISRDLAHAVVPMLKIAPPVVTGSRPRDAAFERCMVRLAPLQLQQASGSVGERMAVFYLDTLATAANVTATPVAYYGGVFGPSAALTLGDLGR